jgi:hypothetical protein
VSDRGARGTEGSTQSACGLGAHSTSDGSTHSASLGARSTEGSTQSASPSPGARTSPSGTTAQSIDALVRAVLYEGYALYPYRPSALKNQRRFAFGAVYPRTYAARTGEPWTLRAECVVDGGRTADIVVRFLLLQRGGSATEHAIPIVRELAEGAWRESHAVERGELRELKASPGSDTCADESFESSKRPQIQLDVAITEVGDGLHRIAIEIENRTPLDTADHETAMDATLASTHVVIRVIGGRAVSAIDPPPRAAAAIAACRTLGCYPVVVARDTILASPIVLPDYPVLAPESPGDFFDGTEIDEMLTLRVLTMTDAEKREASAADPRVAELIARTEALGIAATARLHGATAIGPRVGTRVRLHPTRRADAFDIVLAGRLATIAAVERDLDGRVHCAVTIDDDPGADLGACGMPGHRFYFSPDELEVIG